MSSLSLGETNVMVVFLLVVSSIFVRSGEMKECLLQAL